MNGVMECAQIMQLHIDTFHKNIEEDHISRNILGAGNRIGHVHVADSNGGYPGSGHYNFSETITAFEKVGYQGVLSVECQGLSTQMEAAQEAYRILHRAIVVA
jgi:sugar phosphate isomerase/epimerase